MTIDKEKLISLLEERTGLDRPDVESQLSELVNRIQQAADEGKTFEVEGFGVFSMQEDTLQFEPSDRLETEINNKYAGMKPIELIGAFKEPEADEEVPEMADPDDAKTEEKWTFDPQSEESEEHEDLPAKEKESEELEKEVSDQPEEVVAPGIDVSEETSDDVFDTVFGAEAEPDDDDIIVEEDEELVSSSDKELPKEKNRDAIGSVLVALVVIISLGISGYVIYDLSYSDTDSRQNTASTSEQAESPRQSTDDDPESAEEELAEERSEPEEDEEVSTGDDTQTQGNEGEERYGLHGTPNESVNSGYTIVVHSLRNGEKARQNQQRLQEAGFRTLINEVRMQGTTYYRVGLGQFETVDDAQDAVGEIPREYRKSNFIKRIQ